MAIVQTLDLTADIIDTRDIIARFEQLEDQLFHGIDNDLLSQDTQEYADAHAEYNVLQVILEELCGAGGDEQWRGDWYPVTLIRDSYFTDYAEELVSECYDFKLPSFVHVDWEATAREVRMDYSSVDIDGVTYWYR